MNTNSIKIRLSYQLTLFSTFSLCSQSFLDKSIESLYASLLPNPKFLRLSLTTPQLLPGFMSLLNNLRRLLGIQPFFIKAKSIQWLIIRCLVPPKPFSNPILDSSGDIGYIIVFLRKFIIGGNNYDLSVRDDEIENSEMPNMRIDTHVKNCIMMILPSSPIHHHRSWQ